MKKVLMILVLTMILVFTSTQELNAGTTVGENFTVSITEGLKTFYGEDVVFDYVAINGDLVNINGSIYETVLDGDFVIGEDTITISSRYLYSILDRRPDISMTVFSWVFNSDDGLYTVVGYLFIDLQEGKDEYTARLNPPKIAESVKPIILEHEETKLTSLFRFIFEKVKIVVDNAERLINQVQGKKIINRLSRIK